MIPVDLASFEESLRPLLSGEGRSRPEGLLDTVCRHHRVAWQTGLFRAELARLLEEAEPPEPPPEGSLWDRVRVRLERFDHRPTPLGLAVLRTIDRELHLEGRPFLVTEGSAEPVAEQVEAYLAAASPAEVEALALEQLVKLHPALGVAVRPELSREPRPDLAVRAETFDLLRDLHRAAEGTRAGGSAEEIAWRVAVVLSRAAPSWRALDVDGLVTVCHSAGIEPPVELQSALGLFGESVTAALPRLGATTREVDAPCDTGAWIAPADVPAVLEFLHASGTAIIRAATRHGEGARCASFLRRVRECLVFAERRALGFLEASGIPTWPLDDLSSPSA